MRVSFFVFVLTMAIGSLDGRAAQQQTALEETLSGPDAHQIGAGPHGHLLGDWGGARSSLFDRGVKFDVHYVSDSLWNLESVRPTVFVMWNRIRGTMDIDLGMFKGYEGWYFHATGLWQAGGNLGEYLGLITGPSGLASEDTFRLDSWWLEKRWFTDRLTIRGGQFAGQDFYGTQHYGASYIFEPMGYALGNLFTDFESFDPPSTPAAEIRVVPARHMYVKLMVEAEDRTPFANNPTGFVPEFHGVPVSLAEIAFTPGKKASSVRAFDDVESRKGYSGLYQFGASYNPATFTTAAGTQKSSNHLFYWMASQALWRVDPREARGLDATFAYDWSPADLNNHNIVLAAGLRFNEPLRLRFHHTMSLGYVRNTLSQQFVPPGTPPFKPENGFEFNVLLDVTPMLLLQPVFQYYVNVGGRTQRATVVGFRTKLEL